MQRVVVPELMDDPAITPREHERALAGLARLNRWSRSEAGLWAAIHAEARTVAPRLLKVLDLATGSGDLPVRLATRARQTGIPLALSACDISPLALDLARERAAANGVAIEFFQHNVVQDALPAGYDVIVTSLFLHHLAEADAIRLLRSMTGSATRLVLVNDLCRSRFNLALVTLASRLLTRSPVVHFDGPASVRAAFTIAEAEQLTTEAGLNPVKITSQFPCRWLLSWRKPA